MRILFFILIIALTSSQHPIPIPKLNLQEIGGYWYIPWLVFIGNPAKNNYTDSCFGLNILTSLDKGIVQMALESSEGVSEGSFEIESISSSNSSWSGQKHITIDWVAIDPISTSWGVITIEGEAFLVSRTPNISTLIVAGVNLLLSQEGFNTNQSSYTNQNCQQLTPAITPLSGINLSSLGGLWYVPWGYNFSKVDASTVCFSVEVDFSSTYSGILNISLFENGEFSGSQNATLEVTVSNSAIWVIDNVAVYWIAADTVNYQWGLGVFNAQNQITAWILSRTPTIDSSIVSNAITILESQNIPSSNLVYYSSQC